MVFWHDNGMTGALYFCEIVGPGSALFDYDSDGDLDVFIPQGHLLKSGVEDDPRLLGKPANHLSGGRLYRNNGNDESGVPQFVDVTELSEIKANGYGMGCAVSDIDGDGDLDLFLTNFGSDQLWQNNGDGTFTEGAKEAGLDDHRWTTSALFVDLDNDGFEDLYVCSYVNYSLETHKECYAGSSAIEYCGPSSYPPLPDRMYRNRGDGTFEDVTSASGVGAKPGAGLGVVSADIDGDGLLDLYVANDGMANRFWRQLSPFYFEDSALLSGCAVNRDGRPEASMGADVADFDGDGDFDLFLTHLAGETNTLYVNDGKGIFDDHSVQSGLGFPSRRWTGFGTAWCDLENNGLLDLFVANGAVEKMEEKVAAGELHPLSQPDQVFLNNGDSLFSELPAQRAVILTDEAVGRGAAMGDIDNDGDIDILVTNNAGHSKLLQNQIGSKNNWLGLDLRRRNDQVASAVRCQITTSNGNTLFRYAKRSGSYLCTSDPRVIVGLESQKGPVQIRVFWPGGNAEDFEITETRRYQRLTEGQGGAVK
ncbi:MAG: CRTAC1 family protein [Planctomycetota bacterium]